MQCSERQCAVVCSVFNENVARWLTTKAQLQRMSFLPCVVADLLEWFESRHEHGNAFSGAKQLSRSTMAGMTRLACWLHPGRHTFRLWQQNNIPF